jgi:hypothetical protein
MPANNNYLANMEPRTPTRLKSALGDYLAGVELEAAAVARGARPDNELAQLFAEFVHLADTHIPERAAAVKKRMAAALDHVAREPRFAAYRGLSLASGDVLDRVDLRARHQDRMRDLAEHWVDIAPEVPGAHGRPEHGLVVVPQAPNRWLRFHVRSVKCYDETGGPFLEWAGGTDEIYCGVVGIDESGQTSSGGIFKVANFDDGDVRDYGYPGKTLMRFDLREGNGHVPLHYATNVVLIEHDFGDLPGWLEKLMSKVGKLVATYVATLAGATIGTYLGPLGTLIGAAVGAAIGFLVGKVKEWLEDDVVGVATLKATINGYSGGWVDSGGLVSDVYTRRFKSKKHKSDYELRWRCSLES